MTTGPDRFRGFVAALDDLALKPRPEAEWLREGGARLSELVSHDDWLPDTYGLADPQRYRQNLLYRHPRAAYCVVSFVWGPGQSTPIHNHTVWGLVGVLRGAEIAERFAFDRTGELVAAGTPERLEAGAVDPVSPTVGDIHRVSNAYDDRTSVSIHVYGADIGAVTRSVFTPEGRPRPFVSGYSNLQPLISART